MPDILQDLPIARPPTVVYDAISTPRGLDAWWTLTATGKATVGAEFALGFGPEYAWRAVVTKARAPEVFELQLTSADADWTGTLVGFELAAQESGSWLRFSHRNWPSANQHFRTSCHCWALYLRVLRRYLEAGEVIAYEDRLGV